MFSQFRVTPLKPAEAAKVAMYAGIGSAGLKALRDDRNITEVCLPTGAKLVYVETEARKSFGIFSYAHDGSDGRKAYEEAMRRDQEGRNLAEARESLALWAAHLPYQEPHYVM